MWIGNRRDSGADDSSVSPSSEGAKRQHPYLFTVINPVDKTKLFLIIRSDLIDRWNENLRFEKSKIVTSILHPNIQSDY